eukprot:14147020-Ditylum_brightwellii.AAC.1
MDKQNHELDCLANQNCILVDNNQLDEMEILFLLDQSMRMKISLFELKYWIWAMSGPKNVVIWGLEDHWNVYKVIFEKDSLGKILE